jgi:Sec-independent protein secretion pathway component TatC
MRSLRRPELLAALCFGVAALGPIGSWALLLFHARSVGVGPLESAVSQLQYTFSAVNEKRLWFIGWALLPLLLLALTWVSLGASATSKRSRGYLVVASAVVSVFAIPFWPEVAFVSALGTCCSVVLYRAA